MVQAHNQRLGQKLLFVDILLSLLALPLSSVLRLVSEWGKPITNAQVAIPWQLYIVVAVIWMVVFLIVQPHQAIFAETLVETAGHLLSAVTLASLGLAGALFFSFRELSRLQLLYFTALDLTLLLVLHITVRFVTHAAATAWQRKVLIVGSGAQAQHFLQELAEYPVAGLLVVGCTADDNPGLQDVPVLGPIAATPRIVERYGVDQVIFAISEQEEITRLSLEMSRLPVALHLVPSLLDLAFPRMPLENVGGIGLVSLQEPALTASQRFLKRSFDLAGAALLLLLFSPMLLVIAVLVRIDSPGPIFFRQERIGTRGRRFTMIKFRTMYRDAEQRWPDVAIERPGGSIVHKHEDDPRVTRLGRRLRRASLDELPQLINVLRGEMSLVGPRPELPGVAATYSPWQWQRFRVPAGMTGWWQVNGRSINPMHLHTEDDMYYIQNYSFWLDLKILWMTIPVVVKGKGAF